MLVIGVLSLLIAGCGGGALSLDAYFEQVDRAATAYNDATTALADAYQAELEKEFSSLQETSGMSDPAQVGDFVNQLTQVAIVKTADLFTQTRALLQTFVDELRAIEPPQQAASAHDEAIAAGELSLSQLPALIESVRAIPSIQDLEGVISSSAFSDAQQRFGASCTRLEELAAGNGIEVDLSCPG